LSPDFPVSHAPSTQEHSTLLSRQEPS
jgi:hypothetical protein